jgi:hypothetical protein
MILAMPLWVKRKQHEVIRRNAVVVLQRPLHIRVRGFGDHLGVIHALFQFPRGDRGLDQLLEGGPVVVDGACQAGVVQHVLVALLDRAVLALGDRLALLAQGCHRREVLLVGGLVVDLHRNLLEVLALDGVGVGDPSGDLAHPIPGEHGLQGIDCVLGHVSPPSRTGGACRSPRRSARPWRWQSSASASPA